MTRDSSADENDRRTVEIDMTAIDSVDLSNIGLTGDLAEAVVEIAGEPNAAGVLDDRVRITGTVTVELVREGEHERR